MSGLCAGGENDGFEKPPFSLPERSSRPNFPACIPTNESLTLKYYTTEDTRKVDSTKKRTAATPWFVIEMLTPWI
jgi:hypothetical protein